MATKPLTPFDGAEPVGALGMVDQLLSGLTSQDAQMRNEQLALSAGVLSGTPLGNGISAQMAQRNKQQELTTHYLPLILQTIQQQQAAQQRQEMLNSILGPGGLSSLTGGGMSPGAFAPSAGGMGPTMPPQMMPQGFAGLNPNQIAALKAGPGIDLTDFYKWTQEPQKLEQGATYRNRLDGSERFMAKVGEGIGMQNGVYAPLPGYVQSQAALEGAKTTGQEAAKSQFDLVEATVPDGKGGTVKVMVPRAEALQQAGGPGASRSPGRPDSQRISPDEQRAHDAEAIQLLQDELANPKLPPDQKAGLQRELARLQNAQTQSGFPTPSLPGMQKEPSTTQQASAEATKARAVKTAEADVVRDTANQSEAKRFNQMQSTVSRAIELLNAGPTGSGAGRAIDATAAFVGKSTKGAELSQQLKVLGGWLTSNVPRMEGPQSDRDVIQYAQMAGMVGDDSIPVERRLAAAKEVQSLQQKYAALNGWKSQGGATGSFGANSSSSGWGIREVK